MILRQLTPPPNNPSGACVRVWCPRAPVAYEAAVDNIDTPQRGKNALHVNSQCSGSGGVEVRQLKQTTFEGPCYCR